MFDITSILGDALSEISIVDIGAMDVGGDTSFQSLPDRGLAHLVGFEPIEEECEKLNQQSADHLTYLPNFVGDGKVHPFYITQAAMSSSLYEPNLPLLGHFQHLEEYMRVVQTAQVQTRRLDEIAEVGDVDLLKVDVDGAELDVFRGASRVLKDTLVVQTEVHFVPLYKQAPLFADVDSHLREQGFLFHQFEGHAGRAFKPLMLSNQPYRGFGQWLWADAVYVKSFESFGELSVDKLLKLAVILHEVYRSYDMAALALQHYDALTGCNIQPIYLNRLAGGDTAAA
ncbi:FkbM family methyltransferase [Symmachiella dynata]|uniref:FkbM family methyltransferase n=1 Tax=Symmachiella dynata TaxID=2527995 RepID=UPI0030ED8CAE